MTLIHNQESYTNAKPQLSKIFSRANDGRGMITIHFDARQCMVAGLKPIPFPMAPDHRYWKMPIMACKSNGL
jgi:hypothetical protein